MAIPPTSSPSSSVPQPLSFPAPVFAKLAPGPYLRAHLQLPTPLRPNRRTPTQTRPPTLNTGSLSHASGSAVVRVGDTAVVCGVRGEILLASDVGSYRVSRGETQGLREQDGGHDEDGRRRKERHELADLGLLVPNLELATGCSPAHLPGSPPSPLAQSLSHRLLTLLHISDLISLEDLRIWHIPDRVARPERLEGEEEEEPVPEVKAFWTLYMDIWFISLDGNPFDAAWGAVLAALKDTKLPRAWWDADRQAVLCDDRVAEAQRLRLRGFPVAATFAVFEDRGEGSRERETEKGKGSGRGETKWVLADPDGFEEGLCEEGVTVVVDGEDGGEGKVLRLEKSGGVVVGVREMRELVRLAEWRWKEWRDVIVG